MVDGDNTVLPSTQAVDSDGQRTQSRAVEARQLASDHAYARARPGRTWIPDYLRRQETLLEKAYRHLARAFRQELVVSSSAEWLLDNFYIIQKAQRQIREDMPATFYQQLPKLEDDTPRVIALARALTEVSSAHLDIEGMELFVRDYQDVTPLTMGEVWALPTMLRLTLLVYLTQAVHQFMPGGQEAPEPPAEIPVSPALLPSEDIVANVIRSLRLLATEDWKDFFERTSLAEQTLRTDPAGVYPQMDFQTRDRYRKVVEVMALTGEHSEVEVARSAVQLAQQGAHDHERRRHVGYYLIDAGRWQLEVQVGYRPGVSVRLRRWVFDHPTLVYLGAISMLTVLVVLLLLEYAGNYAASTAMLIAVVCVTLLPAVTIVVDLLNWLITNLVPPRILPKLDFTAGIPEDAATMVVIPTLLSDSDGVDSLLRQLELHYLRNTDDNLHFALLTDYPDADEQETPEDVVVLDRAIAGIRTLNDRYVRASAGPFYLLHRERRWNPSEQIWMGWERKRGKLEEFNRLVAGDRTTSYTHIVGDDQVLPTIRYVITLDADTVLPAGEGSRLVGTLAHPLNRPLFDAAGNVVAGYTVLQPRTEIHPLSANRSLFTRVFAGEAGIDLYSHAASDVYQDLFGEGIYAGKGIYDVAAFRKSLEGRVPENSLLSHDLFEGVHGRAGLVSDIVLYEEYPPAYLAYVQRTHRWIRGDWQLLPWLLPRVPDASVRLVSSPLSLIDRWKILDNLRRSLLPPALLILVALGWLTLPGSPLAWTLLMLVTPAIPIITGVITDVIRNVLDRKTSIAIPRSLEARVLRWTFLIVFLPHETLLALDAIATTGMRLTVTRRHLLRWTTAAHAARIFHMETEADPTWRQMGASLLVSIGLLTLVAWFNPQALFVAVPLTCVWLAAPLVAIWISEPRVPEEREALSSSQRRMLRRLARRTWLYFEQFAGPDDNWLPPDHFQESPRGIVAHRTSPTNIGLMLLSAVSALHLGYLGPHTLIRRLHDTFDHIDQLERYRGHLLNWYDTRTLEALAPRYVSTVDSGNLAGCLIALREECGALVDSPVVTVTRWQGVLDTLDVVAEIVATIAPAESALTQHLVRMHERIESLMTDTTNWTTLLNAVLANDLPELDRHLKDMIDAGTVDVDPARLRQLRLWLQRLRFQLAELERDIGTFYPWNVFFRSAPPITEGEPGQRLRDALPAAPPLADISDVCREARSRLKRLMREIDDDDAYQWCKTLDAALQTAATEARTLVHACEELRTRADTCVRGMDFEFLYDSHYELFHIGYNVDSGTLDTNSYDLLASEARIASLVAIGLGQIPQDHWLHLGRPLTQVGNTTRVLLSWSGTLFEYLMPTLLMQQYENTLLYQSNRAAVERQIAYADEFGVPWGISESAFYHFDAHQNYQYRAFGVPGLGFKRNLGEDLVIAPYASLLALAVRPSAVVDNIERFRELGMLGTYGLYEAVDFTRARLPPRQDYAIVKSFMAHHQGMIFVALTNALADNIVVRSFHTDPHVQSVEMLLQEQIPHSAPLEELPEERGDIEQVDRRVPIEPWRVPIDTPFPQTHYLSNGSYGVLVTNAGSGFSRWQDTELTRWRADTTLDNWGTWLYVRDEESGEFWSVGQQPAGANAQLDVTFAPHMVEYQCNMNDIAIRMDVTVSPDEDVEIRRIRVTNRGGQQRRLRFISYGEPILVSQDTDRRHPAFNKLFIRSEYLPVINTLLFTRRRRSAKESPIFMAHALVGQPGMTLSRDYETDRAEFVGRGKTTREPAAIEAGGDGLTGTTGATLDPIMSLGQTIDLAPHAEQRFALLTAASDSRDTIETVVKRFQEWGRIDRTFTQARLQSQHEIGRNKLSILELERIQQVFSLLTYPTGLRRAAPETLAKNSKGQAGLWQFGISGDYPILLIRLGVDEEVALVRELLRAHRYWRDRNVKIDLVILNEKETGYAQQLHGRIRQQLARTNSNVWVNRRGGIFLLRSDQLRPADRVLLETSARVILDGAEGSLTAQLTDAHMREQPTRLPAFTPTRTTADVDAPTPAVERPTDLAFDNGIGGFHADGREYVIYLEPEQWTPAPWINVVANPQAGFLVSEAGLGSSWAVNSGENRLTPWRNDPVSNQPAEALYLRDEETAEIWSPTPLPAGAEAPYLVRHGAGYTVFEHQSHGLRQRVRLFAATDQPVKIVHLRLENLWQRVRRITATYYLELVLGTHRDKMQQFVIPTYDVEHYTLLATNPYNSEFGERVAFLSASKEPHSLTADRTEFLGRLGSVRRPAALGRVGLAGTVHAGLDPCAAIQLHVVLEPGESEEVFFLVGEGEDREATMHLIERYRRPDKIEAEWQSVHAFWDDVLGRVTVETPEPAMDILLNRWLLYQDIACRLWGRSALYQSSGAYGFRDQLQDVMAVLHTRPDLARRQILRAARHQFEAGDVLHWWHPPSGRGVRTRISDDLLWLPFVVAHYVTTTGDRSVLDETTPFRTGTPLKPDEEERYGYYELTEDEYTVYDHCCRALERGMTAGSHGLPLMGAGDWNDGMNRVGIEGRGESVWLGWFLYRTLTTFLPLCEARHDAERCDRYRRRAEQLRSALHAHGWDGDWYLRAYYDDGSPLGSSQNLECQIDAIAQSWAVLSGAGDKGRTVEAMDAVVERLISKEDRLIRLFTPPFDQTPRDPGYIKGYPPGIRENGGQYTHAAIWTVWAFAQLGQGERAEALFRLLNPIYHSDTQDKLQRYRVEPYVVAADVYGAPPYIGRGGWTWYTGSGGWLYRLGLEAILGVCRRGDRLYLRPCIPSTWERYRINYCYGTSRYRIYVDNPDGVTGSVQYIEIDGRGIDGDGILLTDDDRQHDVYVRLGRQ